MSSFLKGFTSYLCLSSAASIAMMCLQLSYRPLREAINTFRIKCLSNEKSLSLYTFTSTYQLARKASACLFSQHPLFAQLVFGIVSESRSFPGAS